MAAGGFFRSVLRAFIGAAGLTFCGAVVACTSEARNPADPHAEPVSLRTGHVQFNRQDSLYGFQQVARYLSFEPVVRNGRDGRVAPRLAESWTLSADGTVLTFRIRRGAKFHDGSPVDATAIETSLKRTLANQQERSQAPAFSHIVAIETTEAGEVAITLRRRSTFFLEDLGTVAIAKVNKANEQIGTGPFVIQNSDPNEELTMSRFEEYDEGVSAVDEIIWTGYRDLRSAWTAMMRGEVDFLYEVGQDAVDFVDRESSVATFSFLRPYPIGLMFNSARGPLAGQRIRQALNFAIDRELILEHALRGRGIVASTPVWPRHWAYDRTIRGYAYDPSRAMALLDTALGPAGTPSGGRQVRLTFTCLLPDDFASWERMALLVQKQLFAVGVDMKIEAVPAQEFNRRVQRGDFDAVFGEVNSGPPLARPFIFWYSSGEFNLFGFKNRSVDEAFDRIRDATTDLEYQAGVRQLQESLLLDPPGAFLVWPETTRAVSRRFDVPSEQDRDILSSVSRWQVVRSAAAQDSN